MLCENIFAQKKGNNNFNELISICNFYLYVHIKCKQMQFVCLLQRYKK